ncbi:hypothetical protein FACS18942_08450 [Planctomycetales bacterium]|nr:hypothetical protein FACS18942_08450 [Planctomycetales bacterium]
MPKKKTVNSVVHSLFPLKNDFVFKLVFGDKRRVDLLTAFLKSVLDIPADEYKRVDIIDSNVKKEYRKDKAGILDVKIQTKSGRIVDVEIQVEPEIPLIKRLLFYQSKMITEQIGEGNDYGVIKPVINIVITDFTVIHNSPVYHHRFRLYDAANKVELTDMKEIHILELTKLPKKSDMTELFDWLMLIKAQNGEEYEMVAKNKPVFKKVVAVVKQLSADEQARAEYDKHELWRMDYAASMRNAKKIGLRAGLQQGLQRGLQRGIEEGLQQGIEKGTQDRSREIARNSLKEGIAIEVIARLTGLTKQEIKRL